MKKNDNAARERPSAEDDNIVAEILRVEREQQRREEMEREAEEFIAEEVIEDVSDVGEGGAFLEEDNFEEDDFDEGFEDDIIDLDDVYGEYHEEL